MQLPVLHNLRIRIVQFFVANVTEGLSQSVSDMLQCPMFTICTIFFVLLCPPDSTSRCVSVQQKLQTTWTLNITLLSEGFFAGVVGCKLSKIVQQQANMQTDGHAELLWKQKLFFLHQVVHSLTLQTNLATKPHSTLFKFVLFCRTVVWNLFI